MAKIDEAKKLLKKAMEIDDPELIAMANKLLQESSPSPTGPRLVNVNDDDFLSPIMKDDKPTNKAVPVNEIKGRVNQFHDDGTESSGITTPDAQPTDRHRKPFEKTQQKCQQCGEVKSINPTHKREHYVWDVCLRAKMR